MELLKDYQFLEFQLHRNSQGESYVSLEELQQRIQGTCSLYQLDFEELEQYNGDRRRRVCSMKVAENQVLVRSETSNDPFFVIYGIYLN